MNADKRRFTLARLFPMPLNIRYVSSLVLCFGLTPFAAMAARARYATGYMYSYYAPPAASTPWRPAWSPDGKELAFSMAGSLWRIRVGDSTAHELTANRT